MNFISSLFGWSEAGHETRQARKKMLIKNIEGESWFFHF